ncbi:hypothetical protein [Haloferula sp. BvORR071]|uniref:hypothetical protein n=1 Tax=Haloferula sp. BvORR071 TaxID=1396141 RepID=UPI00054D1605|nr:hypothetical protein [Haloferula sp. BvORR071]
MRYYIARRSSDPKVLGNNSGIKQANIKRAGFRDPLEYDRLMADLGSNHYWEVRDSIPGGNYQVQGVEMWKKSKLTDFLQFGPHLMFCPFLISPKVQRVLDGFKVAGATSFPAEVRKGEGSWPYHLFYILPMPLGMIQFPASAFYEGLALSGNPTLVFQDEAEFASARAKTSLNIRELVLKREFADMDFFALPTTDLVVSEALKVELEENHATSGLNLLPAFGIVPWPVISVGD